MPRRNCSVMACTAEASKPSSPASCRLGRSSPAEEGTEFTRATAGGARPAPLCSDPLAGDAVKRHQGQRGRQSAPCTLSSVALATGLRVVVAVPDHCIFVTARSRDALRPAAFAHEGEALRIVYQAREVDQIGCSYDGKTLARGGASLAHGQISYSSGTLPRPKSHHPGTEQEPSYFVGCRWTGGLAAAGPSMWDAGCRQPVTSSVPAVRAAPFRGSRPWRLCRVTCRLSVGPASRSYRGVRTDGNPSVLAKPEHTLEPFRPRVPLAACSASPAATRPPCQNCLVPRLTLACAASA